MKDVVIPYDLPDQENHSFFFIDQRVDVRMEAKLHRHDAWELYYVLQGMGRERPEIRYSPLRREMWC